MPQDSTLPRSAGTSDISDARPPGSKLPLVAIAAAVVLIALAANLAFKKSHSEPSPLEPSPATRSVLVPAESEPVKLPVAAAKPAASAASAGYALASAAVAAANGASTAITAAVDTFASLRLSIDQLTGRVGAVEARERARDEQLASLRMDVDALKTAPLAARAASASPTSVVATGAEPERAEVAPASRVVAHRRIASARRSTAANTAAATPAAARGSADGSVLAVDLWGGKPSVALARTGTGGTELRFFNEGESQGRVTLKRADVGSQKATFVTPTGEFTLAPKEQ